MDAIVLNTDNLAVTEYENFAFQSITPTHAGSSLGLYLLGGDKDVAANIDAEIRTAKRQWGDDHKNYVQGAYFSMTGSGRATLIVSTRKGDYENQFLMQPVARAKSGRGLKESYFGVGFKNVVGADFTIDKINPIVAGITRRL